MIGRKWKITLDSLFTSKFFSFKKEREITAVAPFPLPLYPEELPFFLKGDTVESRQFKEGFAEIVDDLAAWANENAIDSRPCVRFKNNYLNYTGSDVNKNTIDFKVYTDGISALLGIVEQINNEELPLDTRKDIISNLLSGMNVCGPGSLTNITNAHLDLLALSNAPIYWMKLRRTIAEQHALKIIREKFRIMEGQEIHYVNGVLNRFSDDLGINIVKDDHINDCNRTILDTLSQIFKKEIQKRINLPSILRIVSNKDEFDNLPGRLESVLPSIYADNIKKIESKLLSFGIESQRKRFYMGSRSIIKLYGEDEDQIAVDWMARYTIILSVYSRLANSGCINIDQKELLLTEINGVKVWHLPGYPLIFAYLDKEHYCESFIGYCVNKLIEGGSDQDKEKQALWDFICSTHFPAQYRIEIVVGAVNYLRGRLAELKGREKNAQLLTGSLELLKKNGSKIHLREVALILTILPNAYYKLCIDSLKNNISLENLNQIFFIITSLPAKARNVFINRMIESIKIKFENDVNGAEIFLTKISRVLPTLIEDAHDFLAILKIFPTDLRRKLISSSQVNFSELFKKYGDCNKLDFALYDLLQEIPEEDRLSFLLSLDYKIVALHHFGLYYALKMLMQHEKIEFINGLGEDLFYIAYKSVRWEGEGGEVCILKEIFNILPRDLHIRFAENIVVMISAGECEVPDFISDTLDEYHEFFGGIDMLEVNAILRQKIMKEILDEAPIETLQIIYHHPYFKMPSAMSSLFKSPETDYQKQIRERIEQLQSVEVTTKKRGRDEDCEDEAPAAKAPRLQ